MAEGSPAGTAARDRRRGPPPNASMVLTALAECVGTFMLVLVGTAVATAATLGQNTAGPAYDSLSIALSFGLVLVAVVGALGQVSGAHVNPAVTIGLAAAGKFPWRFVPAYVTAQVAGAVIASLAVWVAYGADAYAVAHLGAPSPVNEAGAFQVLFVEALIAFILVFTVTAMATDPRVPAGTAALGIGFALAAGVLLGGPVSGGAGNPARALGPMIVGDAYAIWFVYVIGPLVGGTIGAWTYQVVSRTDAPSAPVADESTDRAATSANERAPR